MWVSRPSPPVGAEGSLVRAAVSACRQVGPAGRAPGAWVPPGAGAALPEPRAPAARLRVGDEPGKRAPLRSRELRRGGSQALRQRPWVGSGGRLSSLTPVLFWLQPEPSEMAAPTMKERQACWGARDEYWRCLDEHTEDASRCEKLRSSFESSCPQQWIKYFDKRRDYLKFKEKFEAGQFQPSKTTAKS